MKSKPFLAGNSEVTVKVDGFTSTLVLVMKEVADKVSTSVDSITFGEHFSTSSNEVSGTILVKVDITH